ncbi:fumarylacetoacetase [Natronosporangium hydrolyticum]|uniref:fumarylacetoacetase n=1 Tax=Natronosporangium hydrolyticum TaxID=2811111 RepID=A0A895YC78_9ACTN|nr:fumarylacetoacetase [Natronosporangium hydrolyticum]QSB15071.1 fumarylacetoacetase [Natronosporangium hydrolyticum]
MATIEGTPGYGRDHLPYGVVLVAGAPTPAVRIGDQALDLAAAEAAGLVDAGGVLRSATTLNPLLAAGPAVWRRVRARLLELFSDPAADATLEELLHPLAQVEPVLPIAVGDYVDFYSSEHHASNVGRIFRPDQEPLLPNWRHLPIGYHGRAGTVVVSGTPIVRPSGQRKPPSQESPSFGPSARLDIEAEVGFVVGAPSPLGAPVPVDRFADHVFGVVLVNDWSARDLQAWEYQPLGPFLGKSFATSVGAWITPLAALSEAWTDAPTQDPPALDYLRESDRRGLDLSLTVRWNDTVVTSPPFAGMYWTPAQQLAHLTVNGASLRTGDLYASGTVSGPRRDQVGSFLELSWGGAEPVTLADGSERTFLADGDTVTIEATAPASGGGRITLAEVTGAVTPARSG